MTTDEQTIEKFGLADLRSQLHFDRAPTASWNHALRLITAEASVFRQEWAELI